MVLSLIAAVFLFLYACLIFYYRKGWQSAHEPLVGKEHGLSFISVIVAARNEEKNLPLLLDALQRQSYPSEFFEVIVVDDFSTDATMQLARNYPAKNVRVLQPFTKGSSKKKAIETGVQAARGELVITTDADCIPGKNWIRSIQDFYARSQAAFIAAPVQYEHDESLWQSFQALDFLTLQGITAASVSTGFHAMCNGANLAYRKQAFIDVKGYEGIDSIATGDDMLLMYKIREMAPDKVFYLKNREAIVRTQPMYRLRDFIMQRKRWASKTLVYDDQRIIAILVFVYLFNCFFPVLLLTGFFNPLYWLAATGFWILKTVIEAPFVYSVSKFYGEQKLMRYFFLFQPLHIFYTVALGLISQFGRYEWKGRKTK
jgi:cellulose synthase/poly-beta-1,6-N-acetylglucosamine synthase-like glycosyltransferase